MKNHFKMVFKSRKTVPKSFLGDAQILAFGQRTDSVGSHWPYLIFILSPEDYTSTTPNINVYPQTGLVGAGAQRESYHHNISLSRSGVMRLVKMFCRINAEVTGVKTLLLWKLSILIANGGQSIIHTYIQFVLHPCISVYSRGIKFYIHVSLYIAEVLRFTSMYIAKVLSFTSCISVYSRGIKFYIMYLCI